MIHDEILKETRRLFDESHIYMDEDCIRMYANTFGIIASLVNEKLTIREIFEAFDFLSDLIVGKRPEYAVVVPKEDRVRIQLRLMEEIPQTAGKLTQEEKEALAFCVYYATCIKTYDEKTKTSVSGMADFTSIEYTRKLLKYEKETRPSFFREKVITEDGQVSDLYGFDINDPVRLTSIPLSYKYLSSLYYGNTKVSYTRVGSFKNNNGDLVDKYIVQAVIPKLFHKEIKEWIIYINAYSSKAVMIAPKGLLLRFNN